MRKITNFLNMQNHKVQKEDDICDSTNWIKQTIDQSSLKENDDDNDEYENVALSL